MQDLVYRLALWDYRSLMSCSVGLAKHDTYSAGHSLWSFLRCSCSFAVLVATCGVLMCISVGSLLHCEGLGAAYFF
ncbi:hypothetical protein Nepgr_033886 [Nepenthes gracilis]|uniref:Uncharacterized protein n=1 Tax=Nepenthes gracilis TaxID=150966 RepID=A0AAD3TN44_NEPGR|nr:hypothetical protein Nepgr_033886 [Nepenthes gracilis]